MAYFLNGVMNNLPPSGNIIPCKKKRFRATTRTTVQASNPNVSKPPFGLCVDADNVLILRLSWNSEITKGKSVED